MLVYGSDLRISGFNLMFVSSAEERARTREERGEGEGEGGQEEGGGESVKSAYLNGTDAGVGAGGEGEPGLEHIRHRVRVCGLQCLVTQTDKRGLV